MSRTETRVAQGAGAWHRHKGRTLVTVPVDLDLFLFCDNLRGVAEIVPTFETAFARMRAYAVCECHKGLYYHHVD